MVEGGMRFIKYTIFFFNFIFVVSGIALIAVGGVAQTRFVHYDGFLSEKYFSPPILLIVVGCFIALIAFFGCCGAIKENHCMTMTFSVLLGIILVLELSAGIAAYALRGNLGTVVQKGMQNNINRYGGNDSSVNNMWNVMQHDLKCCGVNGPQDWGNASTWKVHNPGNVPTSCCHNDTVGSSCGNGQVIRNDSAIIYTRGCYVQLRDELEGNIVAIGGVGVGLAFLQLIGVVFACCLARAIRYEYETV